MAKITVDTNVAIYLDGLKYKSDVAYNVADNYENKLIADKLVTAGLITITEAFTATSPKGVMPVQVDSVAADVSGLVADFNALLAKLKAAGLMMET